MYAISNNYKNLIENNLSLSPKSKIVVDNVEYTGSVLKSYPKISHKTTNMIGGFPTKTCSFEIYDINNNLDFEGKEITVYRGLDVNGATEWIPQGIFIPTADKITTNISTKTISFNNIQDKSQSFDDKYESSLNWTTVKHTGLEIVQDICNTLGITLETTSFNWSSYNFKQPNFSANITFREVINRIAEIGGSIAYISRTGGLVIKTKTSTGHSIARKRYGKLSKEKQFGEINVVVLGRDGVDDDIVYPSTLPSNVVEWKIFDNPFVDLYREEMIETVASYVIGQSIIPFTLTDFVDGFYLDLNDTIQVTDKNDNTFNATLLNYESTSRIKSTVGTETQNNTTTDYNLAGSNKESIRIVKSQVDHINGEITQIVEEIGDRSEKSTSITQDIDSIVQQVSQIETLTSDLTQNSSLTIEDAFEGEIVKFSISGNMSLLYPSDDLYPSNDLYPLDSYLIIQYKDETQDKIHLPLNYLRYLNATAYDEFVVENGQAKIIRRVGENEDGSFYALTSEIEEDKGDLVIELKEGYNKLWLESFFDLPLRYSAKYVIKSDYTDVFATKVEMHSEISQTASEINLEVSKKVDENEVIAAINLTSEAATIDASKINLNGYVTVTDLAGTGTTTINGSNIKTGTIDASLVSVVNLNASNITTGTLSADKVNGGTISASSINLGNNKFAVDTNGNLTATSGNIGGWTIASNLLKCEVDNYEVTIMPGINSNKDFLIVHNTSDNTYPFYVRTNGYLSATNANIQGTISSSSINGSTISGGSISISRGKYYFNMGLSTSNPNCSGLNVGTQGIKAQSGVAATGFSIYESDTGKDYDIQIRDYHGNVHHLTFRGGIITAWEYY